MPMAEDGLPPLRDVIARYELAAKKNLGQNFLFDLNLTRRIARSAAPLADFTVIEVGPGPGGLTRALLAEGAGQVIAVERDHRVLPALGEIAAHFSHRLQVIEGDAATVKWQDVVQGPTKIVANLPYNIATHLLTGWLTDAQWPPWFTSLTLMFQKEVAERIVAKPSSKDYGRLSVLCQWRCTVKKLFDVNKSAFTPPPKVTSSIVQLLPRAAADQECSVWALEKITAHAFGQRRKMLRSSLKGVFAEPVTALQGLHLNPEHRAEQLRVQDFVALAKHLESLQLHP